MRGRLNKARAAQEGADAEAWKTRGAYIASGTAGEDGGRHTRCAVSTEEKACKPRQVIIHSTSVIATLFIAGMAVGAALVMSKPRQIVAWSQQPAPGKIVP